MNNFPITQDGKTYWIARNVAVSCFVFTAIDGEWHVLANQRGTGTPDYQGYWNVPCGYLDYDETTKQAAMREVFEETGIRLKDATFWTFQDSPWENLQNVTFRYYSIISDPQLRTLNENAKSRGGEQNEVNKIAWIPVKDIHQFNWAFQHNFIIKNLISHLKLS